MRILHLVNSLEKVGGAELMIARLSNQQIKLGYKVAVISLYGNLGDISSQFDKQVNLICLGAKSPLHVLLLANKIVSIISNFKPDISQSWLYFSDFINSLVSLFLKERPKVVWNIRNTNIPQGLFSFQGALIFLNVIMSYINPIWIICCSYSAKNYHAKLGYNSKILKVIHNGYDINNYLFSEKKRKNFRKKLGIDSNELIIGSLGRFDKSKGYSYLIEAASLVLSSNFSLKFLIQGRGVNCKQLEDTINLHGVKDHFILIDESTDISSFFSCIDIYCQSSIMEGFPNALCEAMLYERPVIASNVGDAKKIILKEDYLFEAKDINSMASKMIHMINQKSNFLKIGKLSREKVINKFEIYSQSLKYNELYNSTR